jgi:hypothetical protein
VSINRFQRIIYQSILYLDNAIRTNTNETQSPVYRLPTSVLPIHYRLFIDASQLDIYRYHGTVDIDVQVRYSSQYQHVSPLDMIPTNF